MKKPKLCAVKAHPSLSAEWDQLATERRRQIESGEDLSFKHVITPKVLELLNLADLELVLDVGCGTGHFTAHLANIADAVIATDPSESSINIAQEVCKDADNVSFVDTAVEESSFGDNEGRITAAVAVMSLMCTPDLHEVAQSLRRVLSAGAYFTAMVTHPWFWPKYWGYVDESWFVYKNEIFVEAPFAISQRETEFVTTHVHRPLEQYLEAFASCGFQLDNLIEPTPSQVVQKMYPRPWQYPRFLGLRWKLVKP